MLLLWCAFIAFVSATVLALFALTDYTEQDLHDRKNDSQD